MAELRFHRSSTTSIEGRPALPVRSQSSSRPNSLTGISRDVLDRVLDEPDPPDPGQHYLLFSSSSSINIFIVCQLQSLRTDTFFSVWKGHSPAHPCLICVA